MATDAVIILLVTSFIAGLSVGYLTEGRGFGITGNIVVGIAGALLGAYFLNSIDTEGNLGRGGVVMAAVIGSIILIILGKVLRAFHIEK